MLSLMAAAIIAVFAVLAWRDKHYGIFGLDVCLCLFSLGVYWLQQ